MRLSLGRGSHWSAPLRAAGSGLPPYSLGRVLIALPGEVEGLAASIPAFLLQSKPSGAFYCPTEPEVQSTLHSKNANKLPKGSQEANALAQNTFLKGLSLVQKMVQTWETEAGELGDPSLPRRKGQGCLLSIPWDPQGFLY